jgi:hypothetical protein
MIEKTTVMTEDSEAAGEVDTGNGRIGHLRKGQKWLSGRLQQASS